VQFLKSREERRIQEVFGREVAALYRDAPKDSLRRQAVVSCLEMVSVYPEVTPVFAAALRDELALLLRGADQGRVPLAMVAAAFAAVSRWDHVNLPAARMASRLESLPVQFRLDALSGVQYWAGSVMGEWAPVRAWLVELYAFAAVLAWECTVKIETHAETIVPGLDAALQGLALYGLLHGLGRADCVPPFLVRATEVARDGFSGGFARELWDQVVFNTAGPILSPHYGELVRLWNAQGGVQIDTIEAEESVLFLLHVNTELATLVIIASDFGLRYAQHVDAAWERRLIETEPLVMILT
jgi:hypothetical protein